MTLIAAVLCWQRRDISGREDNFSRKLGSHHNFFQLESQKHNPCPRYPRSTGIILLCHLDFNQREMSKILLQL